MIEFLRHLPLFASLPEDSLQAICAALETVNLEDGQLLFDEGAVGDRAFIIQSGEIEIYKRADRSDVLLAVRQAGEVIGEMSLIESRPRAASARSRGPSTLYAIGSADFKELLLVNPTVCWTVLQTITQRYRSTEVLLHQNEKMAQLGTLAAGMAHELNNPAAALQRSGRQLEAGLETLRSVTDALYTGGVLPQHAGLLQKFEQLSRKHLGLPSPDSPLELSDRESALETWLDQHDVPDAWALSSSLAQLSCTPDLLQNLLGGLSPAQRASALAWWTSYHQLLILTQEITQSAGRVSEIVTALKGYIYLDQASFDQPVDIHLGLENTLALLRGHIPTGIQIRLEWAPDLPHPTGDGRELNQVWTHLIENALDAMQGTGTLTLRTRYEPGWVVVEVQDTGPGIPPALQERIFEPFFTTKPPGSGAGLGLNIAYNIVQKHGGQIQLTSQPQETRAAVRLPLAQPNPDGSRP